MNQAVIDYEILPAQLTIDDALAAQSFVLPQHRLLMGDPDAAIEKAPHQLSGEIYVRGQEHFYLEGQISEARLTEDGGIHVISSSQHPSEIQKLVAEVLAIPLHRVVAEVRRMGGGFGGKESQAAPLACMASVFAQRLKRPVRYRMPRRDDMVQTGKRHDFLNRWHAGFDDDGRATHAEARGADGNALEVRMRYVLDASGRDTLLGSQLKLKQRNPRHASAVIFSHYEGVDRRPGEVVGNVTICRHEHG